MSVAGNDVVVTVPSGGTSDHKTRSLNKYEVEGADFCLCDTWGLDKENYKDEHKILPALLDGWLPANWQMDTQLKDRRAVLMANDASRYQRRIHGVLFFVTANAVHDDQEMEVIRSSFAKVCSSVLPVAKTWIPVLYLLYLTLMKLLLWYDICDRKFKLELLFLHDICDRKSNLGKNNQSGHLTCSICMPSSRAEAMSIFQQLVHSYI